MKIYHPRLFTLLVGLGLAFTTVTHAQTPPSADTLPPVLNENFVEGQDILPDLRIRRKTHPENVLLSQYKLANTTPNIDDLIKQSPLIKKAEEIDKAAVALTEFNRISNSFNLRDPQQEIVVHTFLNLDQYSSMQNAIVFDELNDKTFFRFNMYGEHIGIVPDNIDYFSRIRVSPSRAEAIFQEMGSNKYVMAEFVLIPEYADRKEPLEIDGTPYWLMSAKIGELRLWSGSSPATAELLWFYQAPWYRPRNVSELDELYSMR